ncbi:MAG: D-alanyl-D-alanine carboxypeptidase, partial [Bacillota bacterium]|nr:D-alanyl-D-alanine carboxypeptidase [Bacillota bacterium]
NKRGDRFFMAKACDDFTMTIEKGSGSKISNKMVVDKGRKNYKKGEIVGHFEYYNNGELVGKVKVYCDRDLKKAGVFENLKFNIKHLFEHAI